MLIKIILIFSSPLGTLGGGEGSGEGTGVCRRRTAYLIFSNFSGEFSGRDGSFVPFATAARGSGDSAGTGGGEGGTGGGGGRAGLGSDLAGKLVHLFLTQFIIFSCFRRGLAASACCSPWRPASRWTGGAARCDLCLAATLGASCPWGTAARSP